MSLFHISKNYKMNEEDASLALQNVLDACDKSASTQTKDLHTNNSLVKGYTRYIAIAIVILALTLLAPLPFVFAAKASANTNSKADIQVTNFYVQDNILYMCFEGSFIDYDSVYAITPTGDKVLPSEVNPKTGVVSFDYDNTEWNIYINDLNQVTVHLLLTPPS